MKTLTLTSNAKVNLALDVLGREQAGEAGQANQTGPFKGYHHLQTVFHEITPRNTHNFKPDLVTIQVEETAKTAPNVAPQITIICDDPSVPTDESNLAYKAAELIIRQQYGPKSQTSLTWRGRHVAAGQPVNLQKPKITITIEKHIPVSQGFGGGSSNAATTLKGLNELLDLGLSSNDLKLLAAEIGMDVPFFIEGGIALGEHFGEQIASLPLVNGLAFTIFSGPNSLGSNAKPASSHKKTRLAYAALDLSLCGKNTAQTEALIHAIKTNNAAAIKKNLHNDFETLPQYAPSDAPTHASIQTLPNPHHLTGAGPGYFLVS